MVHVFATGPDAARKRGPGQGVSLATMCAESPTLQHYVWSDVVPAYDITDGKNRTTSWKS
jgi:hypothetical protein